MNLRTITKDGAPWFVAKDVCDALAYSHAPSAVGQHVDSVDRLIIDMITVANHHITQGNNRLSCVNESGLYDLILGSKLPAALAFKRWVTSVVLPAIRKDGSYVQGEEKVASGEMSIEEMTLKVMASMTAKVQRLELERNQHVVQIATAERLLNIQKPAVDFVEKFVEANDDQTLTMVAKTIGLTVKVLTSALMGDGVVYRRGPKGTILQCWMWSR